MSWREEEHARALARAEVVEQPQYAYDASPVTQEMRDELGAEAQAGEDSWEFEQDDEPSPYQAAVDLDDDE